MPVYSSHLVDYRGLGVGKHIREQRISKQLTLRQLAERINVSEAKLSNVENGKVSIDLDELSRIAAALEIKLSALLPRTEVQHYLIQRSDRVVKEAPLTRNLVGREEDPLRHHNLVWPLAEMFVGKHMEPVFVHVEPRNDKEPHFISHDHEEFMFVLKGQVESLLRVNEGIVSEHLCAGDGIYFRSDLPHCHYSMTSQAAETLHVIYSLRGAIDPLDGELGSVGSRYYWRGSYVDAAHESSEKIALLRRSQGISLSELAAHVGVGSRVLAQIEAGERAADVELLLRVARYFRRPIEYFLATTLDNQPYYFVHRAADIRHSRSSPPSAVKGSNGKNSGNSFHPLASGFADRSMHPYYVQLKSSHPEGEYLHEHAGEEFIFVLEGEVELETSASEHQIELLHAGDSLFLDATVPHVLRGHSRNPYAANRAEAIAVFWSPHKDTNYLS
jgi:transcriptional regulator with XRE-family HTH domain